MNMAASLRIAGECYLFCLSNDTINCEIFTLMYDLNRSDNLDPLYEIYDSFCLDNLCDHQCKKNLRFCKNNIFRLKQILRILENISCKNCVKIDDTEALCMFLKWFACPCRYADMEPLFSTTIPQICMASSFIMNNIFEKFRHLLKEFNQPWLILFQSQRFVDAIHENGAHFNNCWSS